MRTPREPLFLARQSYRRRRLEDTARLLPLLGSFLFLLPLLASDISGAALGAYVFAAWFCLILATALISRGLGRWPDATGGDQSGSDADLTPEGADPQSDTDRPPHATSSFEGRD